LLAIVPPRERLDARPPRRVERAAVVHVGSFPPRACGIATYTADVAEAVAGATGQPYAVVAADDGDGALRYGPQVMATLRLGDPASYVRAAGAVNAGDAAVVSIQHEYGLFGGPYGADLLLFLDHVQRPVVTTLHTTLPDPAPELRRITRALAARSARLVVLADSGAEILQRDYGIGGPKVRVVPHGVPTVPWGEPHRRAAKAAWGAQDRLVLSTFGLLGRGKGIEEAILALPHIVARHPSVLYLVAGRTHPGVLRHEGEAYRNELQARVRSLGLSGHVRFEDRYLALEEIVQLLLATDVYLMAYQHRDQVVSGTLAYALGAGRAVVATPFTYAAEVLPPDRGVLVPFGNAPAIARAVSGLLAQPERRAALEAAAYRLGCSWRWPRIGQRYADLLADAEAAGLAAVRAAG
jgi:glycosyltransferase involved in cell wall biosynthesis